MKTLSVFGMALVLLSPLYSANLALTGVATQTSTGSGGLAPRAIDGNRNGSYGGNSVTHTNDVNLDHWQVDLGATKSIDSITLYNRTDCCGNRLSNVDLQVLDSSNSVVWSTTIPNGSPVGASRGFSLPAGVFGQYVRVQDLAGNDAAGGHVISLAEVEVFGGATRNLTQLFGVTANQSSTTNSAPASRAIDGNADANWGSGSVTHTANGAGQWWEVLFPSDQPIRNIGLVNRNDCCGERLANFRVSVFDGASEVWGQNYFTTSGQVAQGALFDIFTSDVTGDRVRISLLGPAPTGGSQTLSLAEVFVYAPEPSKALFSLLAFGAFVMRRRR